MIHQKISVVVPIYNMDDYMDRCLQSLLKQTYTNYEILLVDDGSKDASSSKCDQYLEEYPDRIRCIHKSNGGLSSARNAGICAAEGEFVIFPDPDDWVEENYLQELINGYHCPGIGLSCTGHYVDYPDKMFPANTGYQAETMTREEAQRALLLPPSMCGFAWNKLYRLEIIRENELHFETNVGTTEDLDFAYRYLNFCDKAFFDPEKRTYHYYQREGAATHSGFTAHKLNSIHTYEKIAQDTSDTVLKLEAEADICNTAVNLLWIFMNDKKKDPKTKKILKKLVRKYFKQYMASARFGWGRRLQAMLAAISAHVYCMIKNRVTRG